MDSGQHNQHAANMVPTSANMPTFVVAGSRRAAMVFLQQMDYILAGFKAGPASGPEQVMDTNFNRNPSGKGGFKPGRSGNPGGRPRKAIGDLGAEARKYAGLALSTIVQVCAEAKMDRDRLAAARELLDRGFGRAVQAVDLIMMGKKLTVSTAELIALNQRFALLGAAVVGQPPAEELMN
jgi:hypothetical protein